MRIVRALAALLLTLAAPALAVITVPGVASVGGRGINVPSAAVTLALAPITSVTSLAWSAECASCGTTFTPDTSPSYVRLVRPGYDTTGAWSATAVTENLIATRRVRLPYPSSTSTVSSTPGTTTYGTTISLSDFVYATDTLVDGATNNSAEVSPKAICGFVTEQRRVVDGTIHVEVFCAHRDARNRSEVAAVILTASDGTNSITPVVVNAMTVSTAVPGDLHPVLVYQADLDVSGLANSTPVTVNGKAFPWIGGSSASDTTSIADSSANTDHLLFSPQVFYRNTTRFNNPPRAYIDPAGDDATCRWQQPGLTGQTDAIAQAFPCQTMSGAINAAYSTTNNASTTGTNRGITASGGLPNYYLDGAVLYFRAGTYATGGATTTTNQSCGSVTMTHAPGVARSSVIFAPAGGTPKIDNNHATACPAASVRYVDVTFTPAITGGNQVRASSTVNTSQVSFLNCAFDFSNGNHTIGIYGEGHVYGAVITNSPTGTGNAFFGSAGNNRWGVMRGLSVANFGGGTISASHLLGSTIFNLGQLNSRLANSTGADAQNNTGFAFNRFDSPNTGFNMAAVAGADGTTTGYYVIQNIFDTTSSNAAVLRLSGDGPSSTGLTTHFVVQFNTFGGYWVYGRWNSFYDNSTSVVRFHRLASVVGNITPQWNIKSDLECATITCANPGTHVGNWSLYYGAGTRGMFAQYVSNPNQPASTLPEQTTANHAYWGLNSINTTSETSNINPRYVAYRGTTGPDNTNENGQNPTPVDGIGGSDFHLCTGSGTPSGCTVASPAIGLVKNSPLPRDFDGTLRGLVTASGAYAASSGN